MHYFSCLFSAFLIRGILRMIFPQRHACSQVLCCTVNHFSITLVLRWQVGEAEGLELLLPSPLSLVLFTLNSLRISSWVSPRRPRSIVEFRKELLSFSDNLNILTMKLSSSAAWSANFLSCAPLLAEQERASISLNSWLGIIHWWDGCEQRKNHLEELYFLASMIFKAL